ncbi:hypothetical protein D9619_009245 [Psilocybe cf. subviscida]|uniref:Zinc finger PHD-type domain-containing protein n=1 Tax=Psilocybe cf. subviscida TaxID=2480587 RepID=A0A8H5BWG1_9AGAR|nr:hypothetical protein D9619_009245 [Psilocybe cf. subviscida]
MVLDFLRHAFEYFSPANKKKQKEVPQWQRRRRRRFKFPPNSTQDEAQKNHNNQQHHQAEALDKKNTSKQSLIPVYSENGGAIIGYVAKPDGPSTASPSVVAPPVASTNQNPDLVESKLNDRSKTEIAHFVPMAPGAQSWLKNPTKSKTIEYIMKSDGSEEHGADEESDTTSTTTASEISIPLNDVVIGRGQEQPPLTSESLAKENPPLPSKSFNINCRCGCQGDGNVLYLSEFEGPPIQCKRCRSWSHAACQRNGRGDRLGKSDSFFCDICLRDNERKRVSARKIEDSMATHAKLPLHDRLHVGCSVLARFGEFWYPSLLLERAGNQTYTIRWWRGCDFANSPTSTSPYPGQTWKIEDGEGTIIDSLWLDKVGRRGIRLGQWTSATAIPYIPSDENILHSPSLIPYSRLVDAALSPFKNLLDDLMLTPDTISESDHVPAKDWLLQTKSDLILTPVGFSGGLSMTDRAQIARWFEVNICDKDSGVRNVWLGFLPLAHAYTVYIAHRMCLVDPSLSLDDALDHAWKILLSAEQISASGVDVDKDALLQLEEQMFERSARAGVAGNYQWGRDVGGHQGYWNPYDGLPSTWCHKDTPDLEDEADDDNKETDTV